MLVARTRTILLQALNASGGYASEVTEVAYASALIDLSS